jgi:predicted O-methyltransferase YrrM
MTPTVAERFALRHHRMKQRLIGLPVVGPTIAIARGCLRATSDWVTLRRLAQTPYHHGRELSRVLRQVRGSLPAPEQDRIARIEAERRRLLLRDEPLVNGTLGPGGLYDTGVSIRAACEISKPPRQAVLLYLLIRAVKPLSVLELGTNVGISAAYQATALQLNGQGGQLITLDASPYRLQMARELHQRLGVDRHVNYVLGFFSDTLPRTLEGVGSVDFSFIDGHHQYQPTLDYFRAIADHSTDGALFVFDDIRWSEDMTRAWTEVQNDPRLGLAVDLYAMGLGVVTRQPSSKRYRFVPRRSPLSESS